MAATDSGSCMSRVRNEREMSDMLAFSGGKKPLMMLVLTPPGHTALMRMPLRPYSMARARVSPTNACLEAQYAAQYAWPMMPAVDARFTMLPLRSRSVGRAAWINENGPVAL